MICQKNKSVHRHSCDHILVAFTNITLPVENIECLINLNTKDAKRM